MTNTLNLSVTLTTFNEGENIERCLLSVKDIADEIIVVDGGSNDGTAEIAKNLGATVIQTTNKPNFHVNKQMGNDAAKGKWILQLDADEVVSEKLAREIKKIVSLSEEELQAYEVKDARKRDLFAKHLAMVKEREGKLEGDLDEVVAFFVPRSNYFLGTYLQHTGAYPDGVIRLFKNGKARLPAKHVHEQYEVDGQVKWLEHDLLLYDSPNFERYLARNSRYSTLFAQQMDEQKVPLGIFSGVNYLVLKPLFIFFNLLFRHRGFADGFPGLVFSFYSGLTWATAYVKYWELRKQRKLSL